MAYSDYGSFVHKDGVRRTDKEDVPVFGADVELEVGSGARVFVNLIKNMDRDGFEWWEVCQHGVMGDGDVRVACYKQDIPSVWYVENGEVKQLSYDEMVGLCEEAYPECIEECDGHRYFKDDYEVEFEFMGRKIHFFGECCGSKPRYTAEMVDVDGSKWECEYDYLYGAGF